MSESDLCTFWDEDILKQWNVCFRVRGYESIKKNFKLVQAKTGPGMLVSVTNGQLLFGNAVVEITDFVLLHAKEYV